ncbi:hypothetical protein [Methanofollis sp. UBA420]|jgi:hypothetical protein|uniref:hypothetical protein n=1 Tax=Methanofollis sp. UBA420 TaxID=1915514 RepID=UPI00316AC4BA
MESKISDCQKKLAEFLEFSGYDPDNLTFLGYGSEGAVFSTHSYIFKYFFKGAMTFPDGRLEFILQKFLGNKKISGVRQLSDIICDGKTVVFVTPYEEYGPYTGGDAENILDILVDSKINNYIFTNFHPKNLMYDSDHNLRIIDVGRSLAPYTDKGYQNMVYRAYLTTYFYQRPDLSELMSSLHRPGFIKELDEIGIYMTPLDNRFKLHIRC